MKKGLFIAVLTALVLSATSIFAQEDVEADDATVDIAVEADDAAVDVELEDVEAEDVPVLETETEKEKDYPEGMKWKPFPLVNYDSDKGVGFGARLTTYKYSGESDMYDWKFWLEFFMTSKLQLSPEFVLDIPRFHIGNQPFRFYGKVEFYRNLFLNYYGMNNTSDEVQATATDYTDFTNKEANHYYQYANINPYLYAFLMTPLWGDKAKLGKEFSLVFGPYLDYYQITRTLDTNGNENASYLFDSNPQGVNGGFVWSFNIGLIYDSRDFEPNSHSGTYNELMFELSPQVLGSAYNYSRITFKHSFYWQPIKTYDNLVLSERLMFDYLMGDPPFFKMEKIGGVEFYDGLGGVDTMRGIKSFFFKGNLKMVLSPEIRWRFISTPGKFLGDHWFFELVAFSDIGNAWTDFADFKVSEITATLGLGLRVLWGEDFIIAADFGFWDGGLGGVYIGFGHQY